MNEIRNTPCDAMLRNRRSYRCRRTSKVLANQNINRANYFANNYLSHSGRWASVSCYICSVITIRRFLALGTRSRFVCCCDRDPSARMATPKHVDKARLRPRPQNSPNLIYTKELGKRFVKTRVTYRTGIEKKNDDNYITYKQIDKLPWNVSEYSKCIWTAFWQHIKCNVTLS